MKSFQLRLKEEEMEALKKDAHRHEMNVSDYLRYLIKQQREEDVASTQITSKQLADEVIDDNTPFDYDWLRHVRNTQGYEGLLTIARNTTEGYAPAGCPAQVIESAAQIVAGIMDMRIK